MTLWGVQRISIFFCGRPGLGRDLSDSFCLAVERTRFGPAQLFAVCSPRGGMVLTGCTGNLMGEIGVPLLKAREQVWLPRDKE